MFEELRCKTCGGVLNRDENGYVCASCGARFQYTDTRVNIQLENAFESLRKGEFEEAYDKFSSIIATDSSNYEAYFGRFLAYHGIIFVDDIVEGKKVPTCNNIREESVFDNDDYKHAIAKAPSYIQKTYIEQASKIEKNRLEWIEKASKEPPYDVFICFKDSDKEHGIDRTPDSVEASNLYAYLTDKGYRVFFSRVSLKEKVAEEYEPYIYNALKTAQVMIVYGQKAEYITSTWVKNEWSRYALMVASGKKQPNSLVVAYEKFDVNELPNSLKRRQCLDAADKTFYPILVKHIERIIAENSKQKKLERIEIVTQKQKKQVGSITSDRLKTIEIKEVERPKQPTENRNSNSFVAREIGIGSTQSAQIENRAAENGKKFLRNGMFEEAHSLFSTQLLIKPNDAHILWLDFLASSKMVDEETLIARPQNIPPKYDFSEIIDNADKDFALHIINILLQCANTLMSQSNNYSLAIALYSKILRYQFDTRKDVLENLADISLKMPGTLFATSDEIADMILQVGNLTEKQEINYLRKYTKKILSQKQEIVTTTWTRISKYVGLILQRDEYNQFAIRTEFLIETKSDSWEEMLESFYKMEKQLLIDDLVKSCDSEESKKYLQEFLEAIYFSIKKKKIFNKTLEQSAETILKYNFDKNNLDGRIATELCQNDEIFLKYPNSCCKYGQFILTTVPADKVNLYINIALAFGKKFQTVGNFGDATLFYKIVKEISEDDINANVGLFLCSNGMKDIGSATTKVLDPKNGQEFEHILALMNESKRDFLLKDYCMGVSKMIVDGNIAYEDLKNAADFCERNVRFFSENNNASVIDVLQAFAIALQQKNAFKLADHICDMLLCEDPNSATAYWIKLKNKLQCKDDEALAKTDINLSETEEFKQAIALADDVTAEKMIAVYGRQKENFEEKIQKQKNKEIEKENKKKQDATIKKQKSLVKKKMCSLLIVFGASIVCLIIALIYTCVAVEGLSAYQAKLATISVVSCMGVALSIYCIYFFVRKLQSLYEFTTSDGQHVVVGDVCGLPSMTYGSKGAKVFHIILIFVMLAQIALCIGGPTSTAVNGPRKTTSGGVFTYNIKDDKAIITKAESNGSHSIVVPSIIDGYKVASIASEAFLPDDQVTSVVLPGSLESIGDYAFYGCSGLTSVTIPDSVTSIGDNAFASCSGLTKITGSSTAASTVAKQCGSKSFKVVITSGTSIGDYAFYDCSGLTSVTIGDSVTSIGDRAFYGCTGLKSVTIPSSATCIGNYAFGNCSGLTSITIPDSVPSIGSGAFYNCSGLTSVTILDGVTNIDYGAFEGCTGLTSITIPDSVTSIDGAAFYNCSDLTSIYFIGTIAQWNAISKGFRWNYNMPSSCKIVCTDGERKL